jgi:hypothetical protein
MAYQGTKVTFTLLQSCTICLSNEKDLAFGCGHMVKSKNPNKFLLLHLHSMTNNRLLKCRLAESADRKFASAIYVERRSLIVSRCILAK